MLTGCGEFSAGFGIGGAWDIRGVVATVSAKSSAKAVFMSGGEGASYLLTP
jgi:hypothetical protein